MTSVKSMVAIFSALLVICLLANCGGGGNNNGASRVDYIEFIKDKNNLIAKEDAVKASGCKYVVENNVIKKLDCPASNQIQDNKSKYVVVDEFCKTLHGFIEKYSSKTIADGGAETRISQADLEKLVTGKRVCDLKATELQKVISDLENKPVADAPAVSSSN